MKYKLTGPDSFGQVYEITKEFREGEDAMRRQVPYTCNPYRDGSKRHDDWNYGHCMYAELERPVVPDEPVPCVI